ncbi:hypothetical protein ASPZODRAFT_1930420 [Penicilliopsis zonata CBS 506.65]|uniref:Uncharacterized protein n=1 Tax=Penicilliopsis zonata CBS 506.65 TaxID=1073090 RepID=A0A1L9SJ81_9EURO|nr:hypothetical protein ASPZODRAFT_1930420 [Penicilliopsis zonata CBS 506.65]OJJ47258.1 hypothetical protein ASPZODRAFT_1930420 [Penicilliopsis zonata CBS 506.65]
MLDEARPRLALQTASHRRIPRDSYVRRGTLYLVTSLPRAESPRSESAYISTSTKTERPTNMGMALSSTSTSIPKLSLSRRTTHKPSAHSQTLVRAHTRACKQGSAIGSFFFAFFFLSLSLCGPLVQALSWCDRGHPGGKPKLLAGRETEDTGPEPPMILRPYRSMFYF